MANPSPRRSHEPARIHCAGEALLVALLAVEIHGVSATFRGATTLARSGDTWHGEICAARHGLGRPLNKHYSSPQGAVSIQRLYLQVGALFMSAPVVLTTRSGAALPTKPFTCTPPRLWRCGQWRSVTGTSSRTLSASMLRRSTAGAAGAVPEADIECRWPADPSDATRCKAPAENLAQPRRAAEDVE